jgi:hypothetical protein
MCIHETIQLSQDGERIIVCGDCTREFAKIAEDEKETLVVPIARGATVIVVDGDLGAGRAIALRHNEDGSLRSEPTYPCARCGWSASCPELHGEDCHT